MSELITDSRIKWKCRRGLLELDIILEKFCETILLTLSDEEKKQFFYFLDTPDQILSDWIYTQALPEEAVAKRFVIMLRGV